MLYQINLIALNYSAPGVGIEPTTNRLTGDRSTAELPRNLFINKLPYIHHLADTRNLFS